MDKLKVIVASGNKNKLREFEQILSLICPVEVVPAKSLIPDFDPEETGTTFLANARIKVEALYEGACKAFENCIIIADDSGLCVDALDGAPGVYSARFAGEGHSDDDNNDKLLKLMANVPDDKRTARFVSVVSCCFPDGRKFSVRGECEGVIAHSLQGDGGFGYDPLFIVEGVSFGLLTAEQKDALSHRGKALRLFAEKIKEYI